MIDRRKFISSIVGNLLALPLAVNAQDRIPGSPGRRLPPAPLPQAPDALDMIVAGQFYAVAQPNAGVFARVPGVADGTQVGALKHTTATWCPWDGHIYFTGGDWSAGAGDPYDQSYRQETYRVKLRDWFNGGGGGAGWEMCYPYDGVAAFGSTSDQPKHPDFGGFAADAMRKKLWWVPGVMEAATTGGKGETPDKADNPSYCHSFVMLCDMTRIMEPGFWQRTTLYVPYESETWHSIRDEERDEILRLDGSGDASVYIINCADLTYTVKRYGQNPVTGSSVYVSNTYKAGDGKRRCIWAVDGVGRRLMKFTFGPDYGMYDCGPIHPALDSFADATSGQLSPNAINLTLAIKQDVLVMSYPVDHNNIYIARLADAQDAGNGNLTVPWDQIATGGLGGFRGQVYDEGDDVTLFYGSVDDPPNGFAVVWRYAPATQPVQAGIVPAWLAGHAVNEWVTIPDTRQVDGSNVISTLYNAGLCTADGRRTEPSTGEDNVNGIMSYSGGWLRQAGGRAELGICGGGGSSKGSNDIRTLNLLADAPRWTIAVDPTPASQMWAYFPQYAPLSGPAPYYFDNRPSVVHGYYSQIHIDAVDRTYWFSRIHTWPGDSGGWQMVDYYDWTTGLYSAPKNPATDQYYPGSKSLDEPFTCKHPVTEVTYQALTNQLVGQFTTGGVPGESICNAANYQNLSFGVAAVDPIRNHLLRIGPNRDNDNTEFSVIDLNHSDITANLTTPTATGPDAGAIIHGDPNAALGCGLVWDEGLGVFTYFQDDGFLYDIDPTNWAVTIKPMSGTPPVAGHASLNGGNHGIYNRMQYVRALGGIAITQAADTDVYFVRTS